MNFWGHNHQIAELHRNEKFWNETATRANDKMLVTANHVAAKHAQGERQKILFHNRKVRERKQNRSEARGESKRPQPSHVTIAR